MQAFEILGQLDGQLAIRLDRTIFLVGGIRSNDADVPIAEIILRHFLIAIILASIDITDDVQLMIQLDLNQIAVRRATEITSVLHAVVECGNGMLIGRILRIVVDDAGNAVLAIFTVDTSSTSFRLDDSRGPAILTILAFRTDKADGTIFAILARFTDRDVRQATMESIVDFTTSYQLTAVFGNFAGTDRRAPGIEVHLLGSFFFVSTSRIQFGANIVSSNIGFHAVQFLQLCHVDRIGILSTGSHAVDLTGYITVCSTDGYGSIGGLPGSRSRIGGSCTCSRIIPGNFVAFYRCFGSAADGYAALSADFCVVADGYDVGNCRFIVGGIGRTDNDVVLLVRQFVVVAEDDVGLVLVYAVAADLIIRTDDIVMLAISQFVLEAVNEVILRRRTFCISAVCARDFVADAGDLCHIGFVNGVAAAHNHDLSTAGRNCILQSIFQLFSVPG